MMRTLFLAVLAATAIITASQPAEAHQRYMALIVGNSDYDGDGKVDSSAAPPEGFQYDLENPVNDARAVAAALGETYGKPIPLLNADYEELSAAITRFSVEVSKADRVADEAEETRPVVVIYFAGHGVAYGGENFLVPVKSRLPDSQMMIEANYQTGRNMLLREAISLTDVLSLFADRGNGVTLVVVDACRNNPWMQGVNRAGGTTGLAKVEVTGSVILAMSAEPGRTAQDGKGQSLSPFADAFIEFSQRRDLSFLDAFTGIIDRVFNNPKRPGQRPWLAGSPGYRFCLLECLVDNESVKYSFDPRAANTSTTDDSLWIYTTSVNTSAGYNLYLSMFPEGRHVEEAFAKSFESGAGQPGVTALSSTETALAALDGVTPLEWSQKYMDFIVAKVLQTTSISGLTALAEKNDDRAQLVLGMIYEMGNSRLGIEKDRDISLVWLKKAAGAGNARAEANLATYYQDVNDMANARLWFQKSVDQNNAIGLVNFGDALSYGWLGKSELETALPLYTRAADQGMSYAQMRLANIYLFGTGTSQNHSLAFEWAQKASLQGDPEAVGFMGYLYYEGVGVERDRTKAVNFDHSAAVMGQDFAEFNLANDYLYSETLKRDESKSVYWYLKSAQQGYASAQNALGEAYRYSRGTPPDSQKAFHWFKLAAEQSEPKGLLNLGDSYFDGLGVKENIPAAIGYYEQSAKLGLIAAQLRLAKIYMDGNKLSKDMTKAFSWYEMAAQAGDPGAQLALSILYYIGEGTEKNLTKSVEWAQKSADQGNSYAQYILGTAYLTASGVKQDEELGVSLLQLSANQGNPLAQDQLGNVYWQGTGTAIDYEKAVGYYRAAADQGLASAQRNLGDAYSAGAGVQKDAMLAVGWYQKAADQGDAKAQNALGYAYWYGQGVVQDDSKAVTWYRMSADQNDPVGQMYLGDAYWDGRGVPQDDAIAVTWYQKSAEQGLSYAQIRLGEAYWFGRGVVQSDTMAVVWYQKAADQSQAFAQFAVGRAYDLGRGYAEDPVAAFQWFKKAADQNFAQAQLFVGLAFWDGRGVDQNVNEAVMWFRKAADQDNATAEYYLGVAYENGEGVEGDEKMAFEMYKRAASHGNKRAAEALSRFYKIGMVGLPMDIEVSKRWEETARTLPASEIVVSPEIKIDAIPVHLAVPGV